VTLPGWPLLLFKRLLRFLKNLVRTLPTYAAFSHDALDLWVPWAASNLAALLSPHLQFRAVLPCRRAAAFGGIAFAAGKRQAVGLTLHPLKSSSL
jgi:hypothetical protein